MSIVPWRADIVSLRPIRPEEIQVPLLFCDEVRIRDFGRSGGVAMDPSRLLDTGEANFFTSPELWDQMTGIDAIGFGSGEATLILGYLTLCRAILQLAHRDGWEDDRIEDTLRSYGNRLRTSTVSLSPEIIDTFSTFHRNGTRLIDDQMAAEIASLAIDGALGYLAETNPRLLVPIEIATRFEETTTRRRAAILAEAAIRMAVPDFRAPDLAAVMEIRQGLEDDLAGFRIAMIQLTDLLDKKAGEEADPADLRRAAEDIVERHVAPALIAAERKLKEADRRTFGKVVSFLGRNV
ncbi:MAG: hypothetical protein AAFV86_23110, partial [Pseudomonadota bacterium]